MLRLNAVLEQQRAHQEDQKLSSAAPTVHPGVLDALLRVAESARSLQECDSPNDYWLFDEMLDNALNGLARWLFDDEGRIVPVNPLNISEEA